MTSNRPVLAVLSGDGVGPEVTAEARRVIDWFGANRGLEIDVRDKPFGYPAYLEHGTLLPDDTLAEVKSADAVLFGAIGGVEYGDLPPEVRRSGGLLRIRRELDLYANLRPIKAIDAMADASPLKPEVMQGTDLVIVRELSSGIYFGEPRGVEKLPDGSERAINTQSYTTDEIRRVARAAFELARSRSGRLCSVDKSNVMESGALWRRVVAAVGADEFPDVELSNMLADNCAMQLILAPRQFDVLVTDNLFGDLLSDGAGAVLGSLGMLPSASLGPADADGRRQALYEPVHGSAPDIAGQGIANPTAAILSVAMMLRLSLGRADDAAMLEQAVGNAITAGTRTADIVAPGAKPVSTTQMGDAVVAELERLAE